MRAAVGQTPKVKKLAQAREKVVAVRGAKPIPLRFELVQGDITRVQAQVIVVGH